MTRPWLLIASTGVVAGALLGPAGLVVATVGAALVSLAARQRWALVTIVAAWGALVGLARVELDGMPAVSPQALASTQAEVVVTRTPQSGPSGPRAVVRVERIRGEDQVWSPATGDVLVFFRDTASGGIMRGDTLRVAWSVTPLDGLDPGFSRFVASSDAAASAMAFHTTVLERGRSPSNVLLRLRHAVTDSIEDGIEGDAGALLAGFVTGDDSGLSVEAREAFELTNTSHITAVSGSNVAVLLSIWYVMMPTRRLQRTFPAMIVVLLLIWSYVTLVGFGPGAVRAGLFASIVVPAARAGRRADPLTALMLASALMVLASPDFAGNVGFWLSLAASAAMVVVVPVTATSTAGVLKRGTLGLIAAQVATLPLTFWVFGGWSPASLIANMLLGPLVSVIFPFAFATAIVVTLLPWLGGLIGWLPALAANIVLTIVQSLAGAFPMLRSGATPAAAILLIASLCAVAILLLSQDAQRWLQRVQWASPNASRAATPILLGACAGVWAGTLAFVLIR